MGETNLIEIFSSIQGEGKYVGCRQIFVRLADCNLHCQYCDTNFAARENFDVFYADHEVKKNNPATPDEVIQIINNLQTNAPVHSISFTGGEPLLHTDFIKAIAENVDNKIFLETNGTLPDELRKIINYIDIISMDIKFPTATSVDLFEKHKEFINTAKNKDVYVKVVISNSTAQDEFLAAVQTVESVSKDILFVIQPVTPVNGVVTASAKKILQFQELALKILNDVRVIPQTHKLLGLL